jgi:hypothetical protein
MSLPRCDRSSRETEAQLENFPKIIRGDVNLPIKLFFLALYFLVVLLPAGAWGSCQSAT